jgi:peptidoglycan/xylan/chitin deacetylase (PgdA/CDA1 family)
MKRIGHLTAEDFEKRINYLRKHYTFISLDEYADLYCNKKKAPPNSLVLTFDDGYKCLYSTVYPILKRCSIPATIFLTTNFIEHKTPLLPNKVLYIIGNTKVRNFKLPELSPVNYSFSNEKERLAIYKDISSRLKYFANGQKERIIDNLQKLLCVDLSRLENESWMLSWDEIKEMYESKLISFESHTLSHPILTCIPAEEIEKEMVSPKKIIEDRLGNKVRFFAYPNGRKKDYNESIKAAAKQCGYSMAFTTLEVTDHANDEFEIPRYGFISEPFYLFGLRMTGFFDLLKR